MPSTPLDVIRCAAFEMCSSHRKPEVYPGVIKPFFLRTGKAVLHPCPACFPQQSPSATPDSTDQPLLFLSTARIEYP